MTRSEAISLLVQRDLAKLSAADRMSRLLDWWSIEAGDSDYDCLPEATKAAMAASDEPHDPGDSLNDPLLRVALRASYRGVVNVYLRKEISTLGFDQPVEGEVEALTRCDCWGYCTLEEPALGEICRVCFWEHGTQDLDEISGPNHMTLRNARLNYDRFGAMSEAARRHVTPDGAQRYAHRIESDGGYGEFHYSADKIVAIDLRRLTLIEALLEIEKRPALWLQESNISNLGSFVSGWIVGRRDGADEKLMHEFQEFVATQLCESSALGWCRIIRRHRGDEKALASFFELLRSFLAGRANVPS